ncbi:histidine phosphatase family protein [Aliamphritea spongicola]|uniref:histidine phosphatase family protein n=1 Tax=Aliamphritea spongicola TaxID=707589 RepID=UPI00196B8808|nr:histidine phosphatase family protein [Aliamphritea spongicola]MBN3562959.1 histidine phosphatase family protein [Aliamphritea spongicola]
MPTEPSIDLTIDLLRHGETEGGAIYRGRTDSKLTKPGMKAMQRTLAEAGQPWRGVVSSPLRRCSKVAVAYAAEHDISCQLEPRLQEIDFGEWDGELLADIWEKFPDDVTHFWEDPEAFTPPEGEPLKVFRERLAECLDDFVRNHSQGHYLWVTHGGVIRALLARVLAIPAGNWNCLQLDYASLSRIHIVGEPGELGYSVAFINR